MNERPDKSGKPNVAVLLAAYNGALYIEQQISSILMQHGVHVDVYVGIDLSEDETEALCQSFAQRDRRVRLLPQRGRLGSAARNFFSMIERLPVGAYDLYALADQDDVWLPDRLARAWTKLRDMQADAYSSNVTAFWDTGITKVIDKSQPQRDWDYLFEAAGPGSTYVFVPEVIDVISKSIRTHRQSLESVDFHDWYIYAVLRSLGYIWFIDNESTVNYRQHAANVLGVNVGLSAKLRRFQRIVSGEYMAEVRQIASCVHGREFSLGLTRGWMLRNWSELRRSRLERLYLLVLVLLGAVR